MLHFPQLLRIGKNILDMSASDISSSTEQVWEFFEQVILPEAVKFQVRAEGITVPLGDLVGQLGQKALLRKI